MTACVNRKHTKKVAAVVTASLVGALSLGVAPVAAMAEGVDMLKAETDQDQWNAGKFAWNVTQDDYGQYNVGKGEIFSLESVTDVFGNEVNSGDYTVLYFTVSNSAADIEDSSTLVDSKDAVNGQPGGMPKDIVDNVSPSGIDHYAAVVIKLPATGLDSLANTTSYGALKSNTNHVQAFNVTEEQKTLEGAYAYQINDGADADVTSDRSFMFTGYPLDIAFADAEGDPIPVGSYSVTWIGETPDIVSTTNTATEAGTYTARLNGQGAYAGTSATVKFTVDKLDFSKVVLTTDLHVSGSTPLEFGTDGKFTGMLYADGEEINASAFDFKAYGYTEPDGTYVANPGGFTSNQNFVNIYHLKSNLVLPSANVEGGDATIDIPVVKREAEVTYDDEPVADVFVGDKMSVLTSKNESFDPSLFASEDGAVKVTVTKDGEVVENCDAPGVYKVQVTVPTPKTCEYGFSKTYTVTVKSKTIDKPVAYVAIDGTSVESGTFRYDGEALVPTIAVKDGKKTVDPADYTVTYKLGDEEVESMVEPGDYQLVISFPGAYDKAGNETDDIVVDITVNKGLIQSVESANEVYAYTGEAIKPDFIGYTGTDLTGTKVELPNTGVGVKYEKLKRDTSTGNLVLTGETVNASNLKDEGWYRATVTVNSDNDHYESAANISCDFQISTYAAFADVAADAWYAQAVYKANDLAYMKGIAGTNLFMPEADITRGEIAQVFFNMAGMDKNDYASGGFVPTKFDDVEGWAWYAEPIAWASNSGIVTGYDDTTFGPADKASREQVAVMLCRYAAAQGKDVSVEDADATLAAYKDGDQVADWAKDAMAWAVENGVFGVDTDELYPTENIQRAAVAAIAVRFQPEALPEA